MTHHSDILKFKYLIKFIYFLKKLLIEKVVDYYHVSSLTYFKRSEISKFKKKTIVEPFSLKINTKPIIKKKISEICFIYIKIFTLQRF